jgi:hypothetical protein
MEGDEGSDEEQVEFKSRRRRRGLAAPLRTRRSTLDASLDASNVTKRYTGRVGRDGREFPGNLSKRR